MRADSKPDDPGAEKKAAIGALKKMGKFLREQKSFDVHTSQSTEHVLDNGEKVQLLSSGTLRVERPDRLHAKVVSDRKEREFFYDGKTFTLSGPSTGYYASADAPPTLAKLADNLELKYGIELPLVDLFYWGTDRDTLDAISDARVIGPSSVDGLPATQYAFRQNGLDWQIWIQDGDRPLPRRLVLVNTDDDARPAHTVELTWLLNTKHDATEFAFVPTKNDKKIAFETVTPIRSAQR